MERGQPEWMEAWLKLPFYKEVCEEHEKQYTIVYCGVCKESPVCNLCWEKKYESRHQDHLHQVLKVCSSTLRAAIETEQIRNFLDESDIQHYSINSKCVVFLTPNGKGIPNPLCKPNCETYRSRLMDSMHKFCSITCKYGIKECYMPIIEKKGAARQQAKRKKSSDDDVELIKKTSTPVVMKRKMMSGEYLSLRKRSTRKRIPLRAPLI